MLQCFMDQKSRRDGEYIIVTENYTPETKRGFPGRLYNKHGCQSMWRPMRNILLAETADLDMSMCMQRIILWVCEMLGIDATCQREYVENRKEKLTDFMRRHTDCTRDDAKRAFQIPYTSSEPMEGVRDPFLRKLDREMKNAQEALWNTPRLSWIKSYVRDGNPKGSFVSNLFQHWERRLARAVIDALIDKYGEGAVAAIIHDGMNLTDSALFGDQGVLDLAHDVCETVCPGINMIWAWKKLDFAIRTHGTGDYIRDLTIPADFPRWADEIERKGWLTFDHIADEFNKSYAKAGCNFIQRNPNGSIKMWSRRRVVWV